jgi:hypothetical protein
VVAAQSANTRSVADHAELLRPTLKQAAIEARQLGLTDDRALALFKSVLQQTQPEEP